MLASCVQPESVPTTSNLAINSGDILVSSNITRAVYQFDRNGTYKNIIWRSDLPSDTVGSAGCTPRMRSSSRSRERQIA